MCTAIVSCRVELTLFHITMLVYILYHYIIHTYMHFYVGENRCQVWQGSVCLLSFSCERGCFFRRTIVLFFPTLRYIYKPLAPFTNQNPHVVGCYPQTSRCTFALCTYSTRAASLASRRPPRPLLLLFLILFFVFFLFIILACMDGSM